jgi:hypothetical protein
VTRFEGLSTRALSSAHSLRAVGFVATIALAMVGLQCRSPVAPQNGETPTAKGAASTPAPEPKAASSSVPAPSASGAASEPSATPSSSAAAPSSAAVPSSASASASSAATPSAPPKIELPRGGREIFPTYRIVGFCGTPGAPALGKLAGNLTAKAKLVQSYADKYAKNRKVLPVFELIAVVVQGAPGADGKSRRRVPDSVVDDYLRAARAAKALLLLNIQPGHSDFVTETKHFEKYLKQPDVGVALDPEWAMKGKQKPGAAFGQTTGAVINEVADYLSSLVTAGDLPEKALVFHQVNGHVVKDETVLVAHPGVAIIKSVDGLGPKGAKIKTYNYLVKTMSASVHAGFKLFFDEDTASGGKLMSPDEVLKLTPEPEYVMYE